MVNKYDDELAQALAARYKKQDRPRVENGKVIRGYDEETLEKLRVHEGVETLSIENVRKSVFSEGMYDFDLKTRNGYIELFEIRVLTNDKEIKVPFEEVGNGIMLRMPRSRLSSVEYVDDEYKLVLSVFEDESKHAISARGICIDDLVK